MNVTKVISTDASDSVYNGKDKLEMHKKNCGANMEAPTGKFKCDIGQCAMCLSPAPRCAGCGRRQPTYDEKRPGFRGAEVPNQAKLRDEIFKFSNMHPSAGHFGTPATSARVALKFYSQQQVKCETCLAKIQ